MSERQQVVIWRGLDAWRVEAAAVQLTADGVVASGTQIASSPVAYRIDYRLDAADGFVTRSLVVTAGGRGWRRRLDLRRDAAGLWTCQAAADGALDLPDPGGDLSTLDEALDCDLGYSPLTNLMPIRRSGLHRREGTQDFVMAWVSVPDLSVVASAQRYEHMRCTEYGSLVRYVDRGVFDGFVADLELDDEALVLGYPDLAERVGDEPIEP